PQSNLGALASAGTQYADASTSRPSDSFPGLLSEVTGGTPKTTGVFYDDSYSRVLYAPGSNCTGSVGTETQYAENIDIGATTLTRPILGGSIDPTQLPESLTGGTCVPVYPNDFLKTNTIFGVAHAAGMRTAWSDKHPAYQIVNGLGTPNAVDDLFTPEINADLIPHSLVDTRGTTITFPHPNPTGTGPYFITDYVDNTEAYDQIKVDAVLNQIDGLTSGGAPAPSVPAIYGMNFQTVSVAEKDIDPSKTCDPQRNDGTPCDPHYVPGGYQPGTLAFTPQLEGGLQYVDTAIGSLVTELKNKQLYDSTEIILTAKHGQSPINPANLAKIGHAEQTVLENAGIQIAQLTDDDVALVWLAHQSDTTAAVKALQDSIANGNPAHIAQIFTGKQLAKTFGDPTANDRTPDIIIQPIPGTIYSSSHAKVAEHGGFAPDDTHVALIVVNGQNGRGAGTQGRVIGAPVDTTQIAPTILNALGLDPTQLDAVQAEHTHPLPGLGR
ncbi:MAG TPA: alkaline phosphatase family protein, partial [Acidimicrobiia bacterium]|nr:alkaline phosphatase family protein [Acidimicrobiia bacterium]